jgi:hypothetical protein
MVTRSPELSSRRRGWLMVDLLAAIALLAAALLPLAYSIATERRLARADYQRAVVMEIVDGEMEVLAAGGWRAFPNGMCDYHATGGAITNLPPGRFILTRSENQIRLEWVPAVKMHGGAVRREVTIR